MDCNGTIGYESEAGRYRSRLDQLRRGDEARFRGKMDGIEGLVTLVRDESGVRPVGVMGARTVTIPATLPIGVQLTELKAAYLIAFTVLGYSWATSSPLDSVRAAIQSGDAAAFGPIPLFMAADSPLDLANTVLVADEAERIAVMGDDPHWGVLLPYHQPLRISEAEPSTSMNGYALPWLPDRWWRQPDAPAFRWDCMVTQQRWRIEIEGGVAE